MKEVVIGLDVGTSGAKALAVAPSGLVLGQAQVPFEQPPFQPAPGLAEQDALAMWKAAADCLRALMERLQAATPVAIAIDSTSGTFLPVDKSGKPLRNALMYNDGRAKGLEVELNSAGAELTAKLGYSFSASFALSKLYWLKLHEPELFDCTFKFVHAADFLAGRLKGDYDATDTSNALKMGVDLTCGEWPEFIESKLGIPLAKLPRVFQPGQQTGVVCKAAAAETGLPEGLPVIAGASDGTASFFASGASEAGDWNFTLGTTLALRGVAETLVRDALGRFYCHRHPAGAWLPGGASNCGGEALVETFGTSRLAELDEAALDKLQFQSVPLVYPLARKGERMPFASSIAEGFVVGEAPDEATLYAGYLVGLALVTRWSLDEVAAGGAERNGTFYLSGGATKGATLARLIATALERPLQVPEVPEAAMGSALLAAGWAWYEGSLAAAQADLVKYRATFEPLPALGPFLQAKLEELQVECHKRGYL